MASAQAKRTNKKLLIFKTYFYKSLNYKVCNDALFDSLVFNKKLSKKNFTYHIINILIQIEFIIRRFLAIKLKSIFKLDLGKNLDSH